MLDACRLIRFGAHQNPSGTLTAIEGGTDVPFPIRRVYLLYDIPGGSVRGGHAHRDVKQVLVPLSGAFDVVLSDGEESRTFRLDRCNIGLYVAPGAWRHLENFATNSVCLALVSTVYDEADYIRDFDVYRASRAHHDSCRQP